MQTASRASQLFKRLSQFAAASVLANALSVISVLVLAKHMGPEEFGRYYLVISLMNIAVLPITMGIGASLIRQVSSDADTTPEAFGAAVVTSVAFAGIISLLLFLPWTFRLVFGSAASDNLRLWAYLFVLVSIFWVLFESYFRGLRKIGLLSALKICGAVLNLAIAGTLVAVAKVSAESPLLSRIGEMGVVIVAALLIGRLTVKLSKPAIRQFLHYAVPTVLSSIGMAAFANVDKFLLNNLLDAQSLGRYSLSFYLTYILVSKGADISHAVLFPEAVAYDNKQYLAKRVLSIWPRLLLVVLVGLFIAASILAQYMKSSFSLDWRFLAFFSVGGTLYFGSHIFWWLVSSDGISGARFFSASALLSCAVTVALSLALVPHLGASGAVAGLVTGSGLLFIFGLLSVRRMAAGKSYS